MRAIDAAEFLDTRKHVHERLARSRNVKKRVALRRHLTEPPADEQDEVGTLHPGEQFGIRSNAEIAGIAGMLGVDEVRATKRGGDRQCKALRETRDRGAGLL